MRHLFAIFCLVLISLTGASQAVANEADVHLRVSYHLYRAAGYNDEISKYLSITNQYIDMSSASSPMMTSAQRQLFHFPGDLEKINVDGHGSFGLLSRIFESKLALAERNHPLANYLIYKGMKNGDLQTFGFGFHTKIDGTGAHVGYSNMLGHLTDGHNPDRVFLEPAKFENMVRSLLQSLIQARQLLPAEMLDIEGSLKYLNTLAPDTYLKRQLTVADMNDATLVSTVVLSDSKLQQIVREDMFKKYEYKWIALNRIFENFKTQKIIHADLKFSQLFLNEWVKDTSMDVNDVIRECIIKTFHSGFLADVNQTKVFDLKKFLGVTTLDNFLLKIATEKKRYEDRLRQHLDTLEKVKNGLVLDSAMAARMSQEADTLLTGVIPDSEDRIMSEEMIQQRAQQLAEERVAEDFVLKLTKDFIPMDPRKYSEYVKQNFEGETINRKFEVKYKDEAFRRFFSVAWGTNWVLNDVKFTEQVKIAVKKFKIFILGLPNVESKKETWEKLADQAAENLFSGLVTPSSEFAQKITYNFKNKMNAFIKLASYTLPAIPWVTGYYYTKKLLREAKAHARDHEVEDIRRALEEKKYKKFVDGKSTAAFKNVAEIKRQTRLQCSYLF